MSFLHDLGRLVFSQYFVQELNSRSLLFEQHFLRNFLAYCNALDNCICWKRMK